MPADALKQVELRFPVGGLNRQAGFDQQPPYTTPYCFNVRPFDVVNLAAAQMHGMRLRGGARPGLVKAYEQSVGAAPQLLDFASRLSTAGVASNILLAVSGGALSQNASGSFTSVSGTLNSAAAQLRGTQVGEKYYIADYRPTKVTGSDGTIASTNRLSDPTVEDWTELSINTALDVVYISGNVDTEANVFPITSVTADYIVFGGTMTNQVGGASWEIGRVPKTFDTANPSAALGILMDALPIPAANYNVGLVSITSGAVTMSGGGDWSGVPEASDDSLLTIEIPALSGIGTETYRVANGTVNQGAGTCTLTNTTSDADRTNVAYTLSWTSDYYGLPPLNCTVCCTYRGRLVLAGPGSIWYMSRVLDPNDWDYGYDPNDGSRPMFAGSTTSPTGAIGDPIVALMPHSDDYLVFGCKESLWILNGDPAYGGTVNNLSRDIGVLGPTAWCNLPDGSIVFLSRDGVYQLGAGGQPYPKPISREQLPAELLNVDSESSTVSMVYDVANRGIHLVLRPADGSSGTHYFIDWVLGRFWPFTLPTTMQPTAMIRYAADSSVASAVHLASYDGYVRKFSDTATTDDGTAIASLVTYGPFRVGGPGWYGELLEMQVDLDANGQGVSWGVFQGDNPQAAVQAAVTAGTATGAPWTGTLVAGMNHRQIVRASGAALLLCLSGTYGWAIEGLRIVTRKKGPIR